MSLFRVLLRNHSGAPPYGTEEIRAYDWKVISGALALLSEPRSGIQTLIKLYASNRWAEVEEVETEKEKP